MSMASEAHYDVTPVNKVAVQLDDRTWPFATENRSKISSFWEARQKSHPHLYNGQVHIMTSWQIRKTQIYGTVLFGTLCRTNFASFLYWKELGEEIRREFDFSGGAALICTDGALLLTVSSEHTISPGMMEFPSGFVDAADFDGNRLNFDRHVEREVMEELAITRTQLGKPKRYFVSASHNVVQAISVFFVNTSGQQFIDRWREGAGHLQSEISEIVAAYRLSDLTGFTMQEHVKAAVRHLLIPRL